MILPCIMLLDMDIHMWHRIDVKMYEHLYVNEFLLWTSSMVKIFDFLTFDIFLTIWHLLTSFFLGGLSLHLNHLIAWHMGIFFWQFGTLPIGILLTNLDSRHLMTSPRTLLGQFWHMSIFGDSRAIWVICQKNMPSENRFFSRWRSDGASKCLGVVGGQIPRLYGGTILGGVWHT